jgi:hypothetical protein
MCAHCNGSGMMVAARPDCGVEVYWKCRCVIDAERIARSHRPRQVVTVAPEPRYRWAARQLGMG